MRQRTDALPVTAGGSQVAEPTRGSRRAEKRLASGRVASRTSCQNLRNSTPCPKHRKPCWDDTWLPYHKPSVTDVGCHGTVSGPLDVQGLCRTSQRHSGGTRMSSIAATERSVRQTHPASSSIRQRRNGFSSTPDRRLIIR